MGFGPIAWQLLQDAGLTSLEKEIAARDAGIVRLQAVSQACFVVAT